MLEKIVFHPGDIIDTPQGDHDWVKVFGLIMSDDVDSELKDKYIELFESLLIHSRDDTLSMVKEYGLSSDRDMVKYITGHKLCNYLDYTRDVFSEYGLTLKPKVYYGSCFITNGSKIYEDHNTIISDFPFTGDFDVDDDFLWKLKSILPVYDELLRKIVSEIS